MLVLSREDDQEICIGPNIVVRVVKSAKGKVRLGIVAPDSVPVHRREVKERIEEEIRRATEQAARETGTPAPSAA